MNGSAMLSGLAVGAPNGDSWKSLGTSGSGGALATQEKTFHEKTYLVIGVFVRACV